MHFLLTNRNLLPGLIANFTRTLYITIRKFWTLEKDPRQPKEHLLNLYKSCAYTPWSDFSIQIDKISTNECFKGIIKKMYQVPAMRRVLADPNNQKLFSFPCWSNGTVQSIRPSLNHISWFLSRSSRSSSGRCLDWTSSKW